jgi:hypothetical protein
MHTLVFVLVVVVVVVVVKYTEKRETAQSRGLSICLEVF